MKRTINFIGRRGTFDLPSFLITENEPLTLKLNGLDSKLGKYVLTFKHGDEKGTVYLSNTMSVDVPIEYLKVNNEPIELFLELRDIAGTKVLIHTAKTPTDCTGFYIEPLKLERVEEGWSLVAWLQEAETEMQKLGDELKCMKQKLLQFESNGIPLTFVD